jgi:hypothetical protein
MEEAESVLRRAMVATITGTRPAVAAEAVADLLCASFDLQHDDFSVHLHHPEDFLIIFGSQHDRNRISGDHYLSNPRFSLNLRPWCKLAHAGCDRLDQRVELELRSLRKPGT